MHLWVRVWQINSGRVTDGKMDWTRRTGASNRLTMGLSHKHPDDWLPKLPHSPPVS